MRAHEFITELYDRPPRPRRRPQINDHDYTVEADIGNRVIELHARWSDQERAWVVNFSEFKPPSIRSALRKDVQPSSAAYRVTGSGYEFQVFSFVLAQLQQFVQLYQPHKIVFTAAKNDRSRERLYDRLVRRFAPPLGYKIEKERGDVHEDHVLYVLKR